MKVNEKIISAFSEVKLGSGRSIRQCVDIDNRVEEDLSECSDFKDYENWQDIPDEQIETVGTHGILYHGGYDGFLFHLAPSMLFVINKYKGFLDPQNAFDVYMSLLYAIEDKDKISLLTITQRAAVKDFLGYVINKINKPMAEEDVVKLYNEM